MTVVPRDTSNLYCFSFDLIVKDDNGNIRILVQSLIHSSDPGQYGVNKSDETKTIKKFIEEYNLNKTQDEKVYLLGCVDGVGFSENPNGTIVKLLDSFDDFFQMNTLFKIPLFLQKIGLINNIRGIAFDLDYFEQVGIDHFTNQYLVQLGIENMTGKSLLNYKTIVLNKSIIILK